MDYNHTPVMLKEVLEYLQVKPGHNYLDGTLGGGGYSRAIAKLASPGVVVATDADPMAIKHNEEIIQKLKIKNLILVNGNFQNLSKITEDEKARDYRYSGLVLDLGLSGAQLEDESRGFSFKLLASPLDMAFGTLNAKNSTSEIINVWSREELIKIIRDYGEESFARPIADNIIKRRAESPIATVGDLISVIESSLPQRLVHKRGIHFATKTFQALRIATNDEMGALEKVLAESFDYLEKGARIVIVSYHSLEDRIVKHFFKEAARDCICPPISPICTCNNKAKIKIITKKALAPSDEEVRTNPRARSAKLRAAEII